MGTKEELTLKLSGHLERSGLPMREKMVVLCSLLAELVEDQPCERCGAPKHEHSQSPRCQGFE